MGSSFGQGAILPFPIMKKARKRVPADVRFLRHFEMGAEDECWLWHGAKVENGYGQLGTTGKTRVLAHRLSYELVHGPIPPGMVVRHMCNNPACVNPAHLQAGTQKDNVQDAVRAGRLSRQGSRMSEAMRSAIEEALQPGAIPYQVARQRGVQACLLGRHVKRERARRAAQEASL